MRGSPRPSSSTEVWVGSSPQYHLFRVTLQLPLIPLSTLSHTSVQVPGTLIFLEMPSPKKGDSREPLAFNYSTQAPIVAANGKQGMPRCTTGGGNSTGLPLLPTPLLWFHAISQCRVPGG
jgi:hypothetical protein